MRSSVLRLSLAAALVAGLVVTIGSATAAPQKAGAFTATGSARQVHVTGATPGTTLSLISSKGKKVASKVVDPQGGLIFYGVDPGSYRVKTKSATSPAVTVRTEDPAPWDKKRYEQPIPAKGYGYMTTRDGTKLAYYVHPPTAPAGQKVPDNNLPNGLPAYAPPYPTLIEYSGYGYANPAGPQSGIAVLANLMGFAVVNVNMRGTGCSGGAYNFFEPLQNLDGYDIVETIARQPWVKHNKVGMMGISYGGISQLFTAQHRPPSLSAITPISVLDATATTLYPGGVRNDGFAVNWAKERQHEALPAGPKSGQPWAWKRIQEGDQVCKANQALHGQAQDLLKTIEENQHYRPEIADPLDPITFVHKIDVPVFLACQWQDEQTGGHCPTLARAFTGTKKKWFTFTNGPHIDALAPETYNRWYDFLQLYVAKQAPAQNAAVTRALAPVIFNGAMGTPEDDPITLPVDPVQLQPTYELALAEFEKAPSVRILFDNGAGKGPTRTARPGDPYPGFEKSFASWPVPGTTAKRWYFGAGGAMTDRPGGRGADEYTSDAKALPLTNYGKNTGSGGLWGNASQWEWKWQPNPAGTALSYVTPPLAADTTVVGAGAVYAWVKSSTPDLDLQATISEVSADGKETFVQNGYLRASMRTLSHDPKNIFRQASTVLEPVPSMLESDLAPMPADEYVQVAIPLYYQGHAYRKGTRIRVTIAAPNGAQPIWSFSHTVPAGRSTVSIAYSPSMPSSLVLPVVAGVEVPTAQPPCPSLRNQPCRPYVALINRSAR